MTSKEHSVPESSSSVNSTDTAVFAMGCFWCTDAVFEQLDGVISVTPGYTGGADTQPTYKKVCTGTTGHAEASEIIFNPEKISYAELLEVFWKAHDPTTLNQQGADVGTQYRSAIFCLNDKQRELAEEYKAKLTSAEVFDRPIVTEITPLKTFYKAEDYHQSYYDLNDTAPYCRFVITPKVEKVRKLFADKLRKQ